MVTGNGSANAVTAFFVFSSTLLRFMLQANMFVPKVCKDLLYFNLVNKSANYGTEKNSDPGKYYSCLTTMIKCKQLVLLTQEEIDVTETIFYILFPLFPPLLFLMTTSSQGQHNDHLVLVIICHPPFNDNCII